jgi:hypothetical protein
MLTAFLLTIAVATASAGDQSDTTALIRRLGADSFDERVAAIKELEALGNEGLPALRAAANTGDARVRTRVRSLIESIGRQAVEDRFTRATMVRIHFRDQALGEIVDSLNQHYDLGLSLAPMLQRGRMMFNPPQPNRLNALRDRVITVESAQPLPFWEVIDRLCKAGGLQYDTSPRRPFGVSPCFLYLTADQAERGPVSDFGPYRVQVTKVHSVGEPINSNAAMRRTKQAGDRKMTVPLAILPEPGLVLYQNGEVIVTEAIDNRGRSLVARTRVELNLSQTKPSDRGMWYNTASFQTGAVIATADLPGTVIRRLRGKVPVIAFARDSNPIVIPLKGEGVLGKPFSTRDVTLVVDEVSFARGGQASVNVTVRFDRAGRAPSYKSGRRQPNFMGGDSERILEHLELYDAAGYRVHFVIGDGKRHRLTVSPFVNGDQADGRRASTIPIPVELRYYEFVEKAIEIPFDLRDIPMP